LFPFFQDFFMFHTPSIQGWFLPHHMSRQNGFLKAKRTQKHMFKNKPTTIVITTSTNQNESKRTSQLHVCVYLSTAYMMPWLLVMFELWSIQYLKIRPWVPSRNTKHSWGHITLFSFEISNEILRLELVGVVGKKKDLLEPCL